MSGVDDLVTWLRAQLDDDESRFDDGLGGPCEAKGLHLWPDRARAEVVAKRRILDWLDDLDRWEDSTFTLRMPDTDDARRALALPYADRPGYREEWRP